MKYYIDLFFSSWKGYANYLWDQITNPAWNNYFYWLIIVSLFFFVLEVVIPWRKKQSIIRKDFWLDCFYMFFNFFLFSLIIYAALSNVVVELLNDGIKAVAGFDLQKLNPMQTWPYWLILLTGMLVRDFVQWWIHRLLHRVDFLWEYHKVHHSVEQMGFAAQLRYHWMENIVYRTLEYIPLALMGIGLHDFFVIHIFALAWGHYNHANIRVSGFVTGGIIGTLLGIIIANGLMDVHIFGALLVWQKIGVIAASAGIAAIVLGPFMKYLFNSPEMHIWHHSYHLPEERRTGVNFALTLAVWDYLFGTNYIPKEGRDIQLGFPGVEDFPEGFLEQNVYGFGKGKGNRKM